MTLQCLLTDSDSSKSWFIQIRRLCEQYDLPAPLLLLSLQLSKERFKKLVKAKVISFWELKLRLQASTKFSLKFSNPNFSSLTKPHPIVTTPMSNPYEVNKSVVKLRMVSGRYPDDWLQRYWSVENKLGQCSLCSGDKRDLEHYMTACTVLSDKRNSLFQWWLISSSDKPHLHNLLQVKTKSDSQEFMKFVLDASSDPD